MPAGGTAVPPLRFSTQRGNGKTHRAVGAGSRAALLLQDPIVRVDGDLRAPGNLDHALPAGHRDPARLAADGDLDGEIEGVAFRRLPAEAEPVGLAGGHEARKVGLVEVEAEEVAEVLAGLGFEDAA